MGAPLRSRLPLHFAMTIDWATASASPPPALPDGLTWERMLARARQEGIDEELALAGMSARRFGVDAALADTALPEWAREVIRSQFD